MKVLHINTSDIAGGAARAAYRLHQALLTAGVDSQMLVQYKTSGDDTVIRLDSSFQKTRAKLAPILDNIPVKYYPSRTKTPFSVAWVPLSGTANAINTINPDIVHLHWICGGMMRIEEIAKIKAQIVWSLHDMWAFTGGCHYDEECGAYRTGCGKCKVLNSNKQSDLSQDILKRKQKALSQIKQRLSVIGVSKWIKDCAEKSQLFQGITVTHLPNLLDTLVFSPIDKKTARQLLNLPEDKKLILFGAINSTADPRKGFSKLSEALSHLPDNFELIVFGSRKPKNSQKFKQKTHYLGYLHDDLSLRLLYSAADVMITPSLQEAFGQTASEAMSCGTPVVAFAMTGILDIVDHKINGYLASPYDSKDLANGIRWVLNSKDYTRLSINARHKVLHDFSITNRVIDYIELYEKKISI